MIRLIKIILFLMLISTATSACLSRPSSPDIVEWGNSEHLTPSVIHIMSDNVYYVAGEFNSRSILTQGQDVDMEPKGVIDAFITKYRLNSNELTFTIGGNGSTTHINDIDVDGSDNLIAVGSFQGNIDVDPSETQAILHSVQGGQWDFDVFICSYSDDGKLNWVKSFGESGNEYIYALDIDGSDNIYIGGFYNDEILQTKDGYPLALPNQGDADGFVIKLSPSGDILWSISIGGSAGNMVLDINVIANELYVSGYYGSDTAFNSNAEDPTTLRAPEDSTYAFLAKYTLGGELLWVKDWGGLWCDAGILAIMDDLVIVSGQALNVGNFNPDSNLNQGQVQPDNVGSYISAFTRNGEFEWTRQLVESSRAPEIKSIEISEDNIYVLGSYAAPLSWLDQDWNSYEITGNDDNYYLFKLDKEGSLLDFNTWGTYETSTMEDSYLFDNILAILGSNNGKASITRLDIN